MICHSPVGRYFPPRRPAHGAVDLYALARHLLDRFAEVPKGDVGGGDYAMDRLPQQHPLFSNEWKAAFEGGPRVAQYEDATCADIEALSRPHLAPVVGCRIPGAGEVAWYLPTGIDKSFSENLRAPFAAETGAGKTRLIGRRVGPDLVRPDITARTSPCRNR
jgi:hypothetical protein